MNPKGSQRDDPPPYSGPAPPYTTTYTVPSAPPLPPDHGHGKWTIRPINHSDPQPPHNPRHSPTSSNVATYQIQTASYPAIPNHAVPANPFIKWKTQFERHYPDSKMSRDTPSIMKVEVPKNRAYPVMGHAACPECFDLGPHTKTSIKLKTGLFSSKKHPAQKCRSCYKLVYFLQTNHTALDPAPTHRPPPYANTVPTVSHNTAPVLHSGHGWSDAEQGHGWNDGEGHGWAN